MDFNGNGGFGASPARSSVGCPCRILVGTLNPWNGHPRVLPWPILFGRVAQKSPVNHHYSWVWLLQRLIPDFPRHKKCGCCRPKCILPKSLWESLAQRNLLQSQQWNTTKRTQFFRAETINKSHCHYSWLFWQSLLNKSNLKELRNCSLSPCNIVRICMQLVLLRVPMR